MASLIAALSPPAGVCVCAGTQLTALPRPALPCPQPATQGGFHGRTYGAMSLTTSKTVYRQNFGPLVAGMFTAPYPYCLHCKARQAAGGLGYSVRRRLGGCRWGCCCWNGGVLPPLSLPLPLGLVMLGW